VSLLVSFFGWIRSLFSATGEHPDAHDAAQDATATDLPPEQAACAEANIGRSPPAADPPRASDAAVDFTPLEQVGTPEGPSVDEAIGLLRRARGTVHEADALEMALRAAGARTIPEPIRIACADLLAARGDEEGALQCIAGAISIPGLVLAADLYAARGQIPRAVGAIERVLARAIDTPGARERHRRWRAALGGVPQKERRLDEVTLLAPSGSRGPFRLLREVARGGAGAVYEAEDELLGRRVAFKVYHDRGDGHVQLECEARTATALEGPGVVRIFDADPAEGWIALEWIPRGSVRDILRSGDVSTLLPIQKWARPLARALARLHAAGFVHADIKPANVLLRQPNEPILGDFGIARRIGEPTAGGSPGYVSPERLGGRWSDPRDDIYGYGRILEDVLDRLERSGHDVDALIEWYEVATNCMGADDERPADGAALLRTLP
jgi:serine/threonine-protein kinase